MNPRAIAVLLLIQVVEKGHSLTEVLTSLPQRHPQLTEQAFVKALCYETLRWYLQLQTLLDRLLEKPLKSKDSDVSLLMMIGLCQMLFLHTPDHVAVTETVTATQDLKKPWAAKLVNAVLRNFLRQREVFLEAIKTSPACVLAHPNWLIKQLKSAYPSRWELILSANNAHPPLSLRVNLQKISRTDFLQQLSAAKIEASVSAVSEAGVLLKTPRDVLSIPGFLEGWFSVQDISPQLAPGLLDLQEGQRVLDACAAPGGKTLHILETASDLAELVALDISAVRLEKAKETWVRLGLPDRITWVAENATDTHAWWDGRLFDRILLDAPCSATGVIRRHPDIKLLRKATDIPRLAEQQFDLLNALWETLAPNGLLLYATCSVLQQENSEVVQRFLAEHEDAKEVKILSEWGVSCEVGKQILTGDMDGDGFYYAKLRKCC
ncbi:MAG: rRNA methyltransferase [Gammaproteobacteria bacterium]|nr:rRNA methyltransferase [Gammaproteobacteria bacterium]